MRRVKLLVVTFWLLIFVFFSSSGYCFFRDDMDHERIIREVEERRQESQDKLRENQKKKELEQKDKIKTPEIVSEEIQEVKKPPVRSKSKPEIVVLLMLLLGVGGYLFYRRKRGNN